MQAITFKTDVLIIGGGFAGLWAARQAGKYVKDVLIVDKGPRDWAGLGGMSGAQPKAANIANAVGICAEVDISRIETRHSQGWVDVVKTDLEDVFKTASEYLEKKETISIAYHGNYNMF